MTLGKIWQPKTQALQDEIEKKKKQLSVITDTVTAPYQWNPLGVGGTIPPETNQWTPLAPGETRISPRVEPTDWFERLKQSRMPEWLNKLIPDWSQGIIPQVGVNVPSRSVATATAAGIETGLNVMFSLPMKWAGAVAILKGMKVSERSALAIAARLEGKVGSKAIEKLTQEELSAMSEQLVKQGKLVLPKVAPEAVQGQGVTQPLNISVPEGTIVERTQEGIKISRSPEQQMIEEAFLDVNTRLKFDAAKKTILSDLRYRKLLATGEEISKIEQEEESLVKLTFNTWKKEGWQPPSPGADIDAILNKFGETIASPKSEASLEAQQVVWAKERATRASAFAEILAKERASGVDAKTALERATTAFKNQYAREATGLTLPQEVKDAAYSKIIKVIADDSNIPPAMKSFEMVATKTALDNALLGQPIPDIVGRKGGSAKTRLLRIFKENPLIKDIIENPEEMQTRLLESKPNPEDLDPALMDYLLNLPSLGRRVGLGIEEPLLGAIQKPLISVEKANKIVLTPRTKAQADQDAIDFILNVVGKQPSAHGAVSPNLLPADKPIELLQKFSMLPVSNRMIVLNTLKKIGLNAMDAFAIPKTLKFAFDFSMMNRQFSIAGARHPISWLRTWKPYFQAMKSEKVALELDNMIRTDPERMNAIYKLGLDLYDVKAGATYWQRPETMASKIAEKYIPGIRMSNRGAAVAVNYFLADVGKTTTKVLEKMGAGEEEYKAMGSLFNELVGRGEMPKVLKGTLGDLLNKLLSSPRYLASRFEWPIKLFSSSKAVRQEAASTLVAWAGVNATILGIAKVTGVGDIEGDPRSSDTIKLRILNKRIDMWTGYAQIYRLLAQLAPYVDNKGNVDWTKGSRKNANGKIVPVNRLDLITRFSMSKESPGIGAITTLISGKNYLGEKVDFTTALGWGKFAKETLSPASLEEMADAYFLEGLPSAALSGIGLGGIGVNTYGEAKTKRQTISNPYSSDSITNPYK